MALFVLSVWNSTQQPCHVIAVLPNMLGYWECNNFLQFVSQYLVLKQYLNTRGVPYESV